MLICFPLGITARTHSHRYVATPSEKNFVVQSIFKFQPRLHDSTCTLFMSYHELKSILDSADLSKQLVLQRVQQFVRKKYHVDYRLESTHKVDNKVSRLRKSKEKEDIIDDEIPCIITKSGFGGDASQPDFCVERIVFWGRTETETRTEHIISSKVVRVEVELVAPHSFILQRKLIAKKRISSAENVLVSCVTSSRAATTTGER